ncbi:hypothetical protein [Croceivirga thetidis]|uniref:Lipoprotein n=1 Tax=Croceivirga thetidis TaxID=2721623 RepID=A0ABX1GT01_9FLAO|nr:hypothetical protein [Croceivirga thetidis]NKI33080.1 hypothetical protein [Croceivirga thetidis]
MKKTLKTISGFAMVTLLLMGACQEKPKESKDEEPMEETEVLVTPKQIISIDQADSLFVNYKRRRANSIQKFEMGLQDEGDKPFEPTQFVTFNLEVVKNYIAYVEQEAYKAGTTVDSLRLYLGNYGNTEKGWKKKRRNTVFIVPAAEAEDGYGGIYIGEDGKAKLIRNLFNGGQEGEPRQKASLLPSFNTSLYNGGSLILNRGDAGPPPFGDF